MDSQTLLSIAAIGEKGIAVAIFLTTRSKNLKLEIRSVEVPTSWHITGSVRDIDACLSIPDILACHY